MLFKSLADSIFLDLSHSGQEEFHSDFLAYLANHQPEFFKAVLRGLGLPDSYGRVVREWKKFDLAFFAAPKPPEERKARDAEEPFFVIENKFKSLPYEEQIERYRNKLNNKSVQFCFLTLYNTDSMGIGHTTTPSVTYEVLTKEMRSNLDLINSANKSFIKDFVLRYIDFVTSFHDLIKPFVTYNEEQLGEMKIGEYFCRSEYVDDDPRYNPLKDLRLYTPVKNVRMSLLCQLLRNRLDADRLIREDSDRVNLSSGIASQKGLVECWLNIGEPYEVKKDKKQYLYRYFIQFDDGFINHGIQVNTPAGKQIQIASKKEKPALKKVLASSLDEIDELKPLERLVEKLRLQSAGDKTTGFNNMIYTCLHSKPILDKPVTEGLDMMAEYIIENYKKLYNILK